VTSELQARGDVEAARDRHAAIEREHGELHPDAIDAAAELALAQLAADESDAGIELLRGLSERAKEQLGDETTRARRPVSPSRGSPRRCGTPARPRPSSCRA
jgi:hypothetical protein